MADFLFAPTLTAKKNLQKENVYGTIVYTGDVSLEMVKKAAKLALRSRILLDLDLQPKSYILFTMHRAENTNSAGLTSLVKSFERMPDVRIVFPIHPRTASALIDTGLMKRLERCKNVKIIKPMGYVDFTRIMQCANKILTDSGGVQKEAYLLSVPCITIRKSTEWVETVKVGWNILTDTNTGKIVNAVRKWKPPARHPPIFGDGKASSKIAKFVKGVQHN
jgi:UDP-N-acetylglucosamine 2-epimerase (non-hydrolysing)